MRPRSPATSLKNIAAPFLNPPYDPGCAYSVPYAWLVLGLGYRKSKMKDGQIPDSWKWVFESDRYTVAWMSEPADMIRLGGKYLGYSANALTPDTIGKVEKLLTRQAKHVYAFHHDDGQDMLKNGDVDVVIEYSGDIAALMAEDSDIGFVVPKEGSLRFTDCWAIPKNAPNPDAAHQFLNYMMDAEVGVDIIEAIRYPTPNEATRALMPESYRDNPAIFPPLSRMEASDFILWQGADRQRQFEEAFARVRIAAGK